MDAFHLVKSVVVRFGQSTLSTSLMITAAALLAGILVLFLLLRPKDKPSHHRLPPGSLGLPFVGETLPLLRALRCNKAQEFFDSRVKKFGNVFKTSLVGHPTIVVCGPSANKLILSNENKLVVNSWPSSLIKLIGQESLSTKTGEDHKSIRAALASYISTAELQKNLDKMSSVIREHIDKKWKGKEQVKAVPLVNQLVFALAADLFFGIDDEDEQERLHHLVETVAAGCLSVAVDLPGTSYHRAVRAHQELDKIISSLMEKRRSQLRSGEASPSQDLLSVLLTFKDERGKRLTDKEIVDNVSVFLHGGSDTTISPVVLMLKLFDSNPECYQKMAQEQLEIISNKTEGEEVTWKDLREMKYTWQAAQETLRLFPPVFGTFRRAITDIHYDGYTIPKGWKILWTPYSTHGKEEYFREAEKFRPERFDEGEADPSPYVYIPFGAGARKCPGWELSKLEILIFMHHFVKNFSSYSIDPNEGIAADPTPPLPANGLAIKLHPRV
uniref:TSA: Wollemia nobilis Ref_Wollemi_Transcript_14903_1970 transcribed RNA sequence n=1 Tax=Wollemia nobilis TaxID=56998 RepID=A0A0C9S3N6_9CONI